jgi:hypothetical protein
MYASCRTDAPALLDLTKPGENILRVTIVPLFGGSPMRRFTLAVGIAAVAACSVGLSGCTHHAPSTQDQGAPTFITLQNVLPNNYQLYISDGTRRLDAGKVDALQTVTIKVPPRLVYPGARLAVIAVPTVSARTLAVRFTVHPGATIRLMLGR